jgi:hypothetical protein
MIDIKPSDITILENIKSTDTWNDLKVSFRNKILPSGNLDKQIGVRCSKLLRGLAKKDKVSASTISKGCPLLNKKNTKTKGGSIAKMEMKKESDMKIKQQRDSKANADNRREDYYSALLNDIVKKQNEAQKQVIAGQVETVNRILVDTKQKNQSEEMREMEEEARVRDARFKQYKKSGGKKNWLGYMEDLMDEEQEEARQQIPVDDMEREIQAQEAYANAIREYNNYQEFVIPDYSVVNDPLLNDPRNL